MYVNILLMYIHGIQYIFYIQYTILHNSIYNNSSTPLHTESHAHTPNVMLPHHHK